MTFLDIGQAIPGHTLVVLRKHAADIWALTEDDAAALMVDARHRPSLGSSEPTTAGGSRPVSRDSYMLTSGEPNQTTS